MERWAASTAPASFVCVCCAGAALAEEFATRLRLRACTNVWLGAADAPSWGQLGCRGFILLDPSLAVACRASPAFLQVGELAFRYVEAALAALADGRPIPAIAPGVSVRLCGLAARPRLNGRKAVCTAVCTAAAGADGRCEVRLDGGQVLRVKETNLSLVGEGGAPCVDGGCGEGGCEGGCEGGEEGGEGEAGDEQRDEDRGEDRGAGGGVGGGEGEDDGGGEGEDDGGGEGEDDGVGEGEDGEGGGEGRCDGGGEGGGDGGGVGGGGSRRRSLEGGPLKLRSVLHAALDEEHERCAAALDRLAHERTEAALRSVAAAYEAHFAHEEQLLDEFVYSAADNAEADEGGFSADRGARKSHFAHHQALLRGVRKLLGAAPIPRDAIAALIDDFARHADEYDGSYAQRLASALSARVQS